MSLVRPIASFGALIFATSLAFADDSTPPSAPATAPSASASESTSAVPSNAPIVLSPGVSASAPKPEHMTVPTAEPATHREWFGYQTLAADIAIVSTAAALLRSLEEKNHLAIFLGASALYLGGGPLIHLANGSPHALDSLLLRAIALGGGTTLGALLISGFAGCTESTPCKLELVDFAAIGAGLGAMVGAVGDAGWYAWKVTPQTTAYVRPTIGTTFGVTIAY